MWFGPEFIGQEVTFSKPNPSTWVLKEQISEHADSYNQEDCEELDLIPEARAVFTCSRRDGEGPEEAIIKILMQIPWEGTEGKSAKKRAAQAGSSESLEFEAGALDILTDANSSSTPIILAAKEAKQTKNMIDQIQDLDREEREEMRQSFKKAWNECFAAGVAPGDTAIRNLLWDHEHKKCYIVDFGVWY